jgi:hypothetical protein
MGDDLITAQKWIADLRAWLATFDDMPQGSDFYIDFTPDNFPAAGLNPNGFSYQNAKGDVLGDYEIECQLNFTLNIRFAKPDRDDELSTKNAVWVLAFQRWVMRQSLLGLAPKFGMIDQHRERIRALNGMYGEDPAAGIGGYDITLTVQFKETIQEDDD